MNVKLFPQLDDGVYLNTAFSGLTYQGLQEYRKEMEREKTEEPDQFLINHFEDGTRIKERAARMFGSKGGNIAMIPSFSIGINLVLDSLGEGNKVLLLEEEYPSMLWPFETRNLKRSYIKFDFNFENQLEHRIRRDKIEVLALSVVLYHNGYRLNLDALKEIHRKFPELIIIIDATQYLGIEPFDFESSGFDVLITSGYKWLLGGYGNGLAFFSDRFLEDYPGRAMGFFSTGSPVKEPLRFKASGFEPGHQDPLSMGSLGYSLEQMERYGPQRIAKEIQDLMQPLKEGLVALNRLDERWISSRPSSIVTFQGDSTLFKVLRSKGVHVSLRGSGIRVSPHFYNNRQDIDTFFELLKESIPD